jgi:glutamate N-acetyltransferase/amino-acid N-acetyltransferase
VTDVTITDIDGGSVTSVQGVRAAGVTAGIKASGTPDMALVASGRPATAAAVYTTNRVFGAPISICREHLAKGRAQAVILNSGNANVCNGERGLRDARRMCELTAGELGLATEDVLVCSTGIIGVPLPMDVIEPGIPKVAAALSDDGGPAAAAAMMTTDTVAKHAAVEVSLSSGPVRVGAIAKGAAMISPNMATMLSVVTTDAAVPPAQLQQLLTRAVGRSFNCCTVDGDMSTSDTVIVLANGAAMVEDAIHAAPLGDDDFEALAQAMDHVCRQMARAMAGDGEGATKLITIRVSGGRSEAEARQVGLSVANSSLVKTAVFGNDPNWGRILCAVGYAGVDIDPAVVEVSLCGVPIYGNGAGIAFDDAALSETMKGREIDIDIDLHAGAAEIEVFTCDLTYDYVRLNAEYTT